jgi:hypothetical protein
MDVPRMVLLATAAKTTSLYGSIAEPATTRAKIKQHRRGFTSFLKVGGGSSLAEIKSE